MFAERETLLVAVAAGQLDLTPESIIDAGVKSVICAPMVMGDQVHGAIQLDSRKDPAFAAAPGKRRGNFEVLLPQYGADILHNVELYGKDAVTFVGKCFLDTPVIGNTVFDRGRIKLEINLLRDRRKRKALGQV